MNALGILIALKTFDALKAVDALGILIALKTFDAIKYILFGNVYLLFLLRDYRARIGNLRPGQPTLGYPRVPYRVVLYGTL